jgi:integrase
MRRAITPPTHDEVIRLIEAAEPELATFVLLAATLGARRGELCGLRWNDVDINDGHVDIVRAIVIVDGRCVEAPTKTRQARRISLDQTTADALRAHRRRAEHPARQAGVERRRDAFVFSHDPGGGEPWRPDSTSRAFRHLRHDVGLDHVRLHDLRHFVATRLLAAGIDVRTVSGRLGHSLTSATLNVYSAFVPDADQRAAEVIGRLAHGGRRSGLTATPPATPGSGIMLS